MQKWLSPPSRPYISYNLGYVFDVYESKSLETPLAVPADPAVHNCCPDESCGKLLGSKTTRSATT